MTIDDLDAVAELEGQVYDDPWPITAYRHELENGSQAHYWVAYRNLAANEAWPELEIVGFGGLWMQYDTAHINTLAVRPDCRRRGVAEQLLVRLIDWSIEQGAQELTLEVRESNVAAQALYAKFGFDVVGHRKRYYANNDEDALIMTTPLVTDPEWLALLSALRGQ
jgi:ribosomal-protein-alanine N-acetyltransferase